MTRRSPREIEKRIADLEAATTPDLTWRELVSSPSPTPLERHVAAIEEEAGKPLSEMSTYEIAETSKALDGDGGDP